MIVVIWCSCREVQTILIHREGVKTLAKNCVISSFQKTCDAKNMFTEKGWGLIHESEPKKMVTR